ncbi:Outer membrane lipoprotein-sorting protein [Frankineae bacterium MT45]|nr:Outer membrane lipoprotein-sorting protein [Frankineae bacterium MT45]
MRSVNGVFTRHRYLRWLAPAAVVGVVVVVATGSLSAQASTNLPYRSAAQLLAALESSHVGGLSGTVVQKAALGLPELPSVDTSGQTGGTLLGLLSGSHTARVWYSGETKQRVALLDSVGETDIFRNGADVWSWSSSTRVASHTILPAANSKTPETTTLTPDQLATRALAAISPSTLVTTDSSREVAGRAAYELVLTPRDTSSRIGSVRIAVDGAKSVPLAVQVYARNDLSKPAMDVSFTEINFAVPDNSNFDWKPPSGAIVTQNSGTSKQAGKAIAAASSSDEPSTIGSGWTSVLATHAKLPADSGNDSKLMAALTPVKGAWGTGRLFDSKLMTVLLTNDGRVLAGAVDPSVLYAAAATYK